MDTGITFNEAASRYEMSENGAAVFARVRHERDTLYIDHVEAAQALRGTGAAGRFMEKLMGVVRERGLKTVPICGYAVAWLRKHPEYNELRADQ